MKHSPPGDRDKLNIGRAVSVIFGPYAGSGGTIVSRKGDLLRVRVSPPTDDRPSEISVRIDDIKFIG